MTDATIGFAGLGAMGSGLAHLLRKHLSAKGRPLRVYNRTKQKPEVDRLLGEGALWTESPSELASSCGVVFSMLTNDAALESVFSAYLKGQPKPGSIYVDCSTVYPDLTAKHEALAKERGVAYLACPIIGRPDATLAGKSLVISAGDPAAKAQVRPLLEAMGRGVLDVGSEARQGNVMKLIANFSIASMTELIGEGMTLGDKNGVPREAVVTFFKETFQGPVTAGYAERAARDEFEITKEAPGFSARGGVKDLTHVRNLAAASGAPMPVADIVASHLQALSDRGGADTLDWGSAALLLREKAGIRDEKNLLS